MSKWRAVALVLVHVAIGAHILHWVMAGETLGPIEPSEAITFSDNSVISTGLVFFVIAIGTTLIFGRFFCGWACHLLAVQDLCLWMLKKVGIQPKAIRARTMLLVPLGAFVYMFLYPILYRTWFGIEFDAVTTDFVVDDFWATFPSWPVSLLTFVFAGFAVVYFLGAKGFCVNLCPYGAAFGAVDKISPGRIRVTPACEGCGHCTQVCTSNILVHQEVRDYGMVVDQECLKCLDCVSVCPKDALYFGFGKPALFAKPQPTAKGKPKRARDWWKINRWRNYTWPEELLFSLLFLAGLFTFRGLYNSIPFLFSLSIAGLFAFWTLQGLRLLYKSRVAIQGRVLKAGGALTGAGRVYGVFSVGLLALWVQSSYVHYERAQAEAGYIELNPTVTGWLNSPQVLTDEQQQLVVETLEHAAKAERGTPLSLFPREDWELSLITGWLELLNGNDALFVERLEHASGVFDHNTVAQNGLANYYAAAEDVEQAMQWFERANRAAPDDSGTWTAWSNYYVSLDRLDEARELLQRGVEAERVDDRVYMALGRLQIADEDLDGAITTFQAALDINPNILEADLQLGGLLCARGDLQEGLEHLERALLVRSADFALRLQITLAYDQLGDLDAAERHARAAHELAPERPEPFVALSRIASARGDEDTAKELFAEAQKRADALSNQ